MIHDRKTFIPKLKFWLSRLVGESFRESYVFEDFYKQTNDIYYCHQLSPGLRTWCAEWSSDKEASCRRCRRHGFDPWVRKISWNKKWQPPPVSLPEKFHQQKRLAGYSPWSCKRVGHNWATEHTTQSSYTFCTFFAFLFSLTFIHVHCRKRGKWKKV